jgi:hypothetical protein
MCTGDQVPDDSTVARPIKLIQADTVLSLTPAGPACVRHLLSRGVQRKGPKGHNQASGKRAASQAEPTDRTETKLAYPWSA